LIKNYGKCKCEIKSRIIIDKTEFKKKKKKKKKKKERKEEDK
jgi:hypothetical protein